MLIQRWVKSDDANKQRALLPEIIEGSKSVLSAVAMGKSLCLKCMTIEGLVPIDPGFIAVSPYECDYSTGPASSLVLEAG
jgi:hypothetical protein